MTGTITYINMELRQQLRPIPARFSNLKESLLIFLISLQIKRQNSSQLSGLSIQEVFNVARKWHNYISSSTCDKKNQLIQFDESSFYDNPFLCGPPLQKSCTFLMEWNNNADFIDLDVFFESFALCSVLHIDISSELCFTSSLSTAITSWTTTLRSC